MDILYIEETCRHVVCKWWSHQGLCVYATADVSLVAQPEVVICILQHVCHRHRQLFSLRVQLVCYFPSCNSDRQDDTLRSETSGHVSDVAK